MSDPFQRSPIAQSPLSVVLPSYPMDARLASVIDPWVAHLDTLGREYELLVVHENLDSATEFAAAPPAKSARVRVLPHPGPPGIGSALRTGLEAAQFPLLCYTECSNCYQPADLGRLLEVIDKVDLVTGYRVWESPGARRFWRQYAYRGALRFLFGLRLLDVDCAFKLFRRSIFARLPIQSESCFVHAEILAKANFLGCLMTEVPVRYQPNPLLTEKPFSPGAWRVDARRVFYHPDFGSGRMPESV